jgi:hypothetical protein
MRFFKGILFIVFLLMLSVSIPAQEEHQAPEAAEEEFDASSFILDHIADSHEWHITTKRNGESVQYTFRYFYTRERNRFFLEKTCSWT